MFVSDAFGEGGEEGSAPDRKNIKKAPVMEA
jgi:hypothetical protein